MNSPQNYKKKNSQKDFPNMTPIFLAIEFQIKKSPKKTIQRRTLRLA